MQSKPRVLVVGDATHGDFAAVTTLLRATSRVWFVPRAELAAAWLGSQPPVDWVVLVQSRPGQLPRDAIKQLRPLAGRANFVSVLGSWCEGELRTGRPWADMPRCYWYAFPSWWRLGAAGLASDSHWHCDTGRAGSAPGHLVVVSSTDYATAECLLDALATEGFSGVWWPRHGPPLHAVGVSAGIWVGGQLHGRESLELDAFCRRMRSETAPVIAILDFPRRDRVDLARRIGVAEVMGKPWLNGDLVASLCRLQGAQRAVTDSRSLAVRSA